MKVMFDLNVMLDFLERREPFFEDSAKAVDIALYRQVTGVLPGHAITTLAYFLSRHVAKHEVKEIIQWMTREFEIAEIDFETIQLALSFDMADFEDAVVSAAAMRNECEIILTRNLSDFAASPIRVMSPSQFAALGIA